MVLNMVVCDYLTCYLRSTFTGPHEGVVTAAEYIALGGSFCYTNPAIRVFVYYTYRGRVLE